MVFSICDHGVDLDIVFCENSHSKLNSKIRIIHTLGALICDDAHADPDLIPVEGSIGLDASGACDGFSASALNLVRKLKF